MDINNAAVRLHYDPVYGAVRLHIFDKDRTFLTLEGCSKIPLGIMAEGILLPDGGQFLQNMMEALWDSGLRPKEEQLQTNAKDAHLKDMRTLVGKAYKVDL